MEAGSYSQRKSAILAMPSPGPALVNDAEVAEMRAVVNSIARKFYNTLWRYHTLEDLMAIGMAVAWGSLTRWRADGGSSKKSYVGRAVTLAFIAEWRYWRKACRRGQVFDIDERVDTASSGAAHMLRFVLTADCQDPGELLDAARERNPTADGSLEASIRRLSEREQMIVRRIGAGETNLSAIARDFGLSRERVRQLKERAFKKIRRSLANAELEQGRKRARLLSGAL